MDPIKFACSHCSRKIRAKQSLAGRTGKCPSCGGKITVPAIKAVTSEPAKPVSEPSKPIEESSIASPPQVVCSVCGRSNPKDAVKCHHCSAWVNKPPARPATDQTLAPARPANDFRNPPQPPGSFKVVPVGYYILYALCTIGLYWLAWFDRVYRELHTQGHTATTPGKAVGFLHYPSGRSYWIYSD